jgi:hypothetical protein
VDIDHVPDVIAGVFDRLLTPQSGEALPTHYAAKRGRGGRGGALCAVRRDCLTLTERAGHARRLRRKGETAEADALESETLALMDSGALVMTEKERKAFLK